ncbi:MAG: phosphate ABC transporter permease subunit PstC [Roseburia sp.]|nr:phosphate ABC transporter permease subunit PstC [Roseburia sp.]MCM1098372.1 phosphate ABC transporter permease subunit PstC [Ruminococcus flavefaciens]
MKGVGIPDSLRDRNPGRERIEKGAQAVFTFCALFAVSAVAALSLYLVFSGAPALVKIGWREILFGRIWSPTAPEPRYGIFYVVLTSLAGTLLAVLAGGSLGILTAIFLTELANPWTAGLISGALELLAGIPSVIYGLLGVCLVNPLVYRLELAVFHDSPTHQFTGGSNLLSASLVLAVMILPTVASMSETALRAVPPGVREASLALGASQVQTIFRSVLPAARPGIMTAIVLGMGRALGEATAIALVSGNRVSLPLPFASVRFLTAAVVSEMGYASGIHRQVLFTVGLILYANILSLNAAVRGIWREGRR